ncbi:hypothetical protein [Halosimplex amylolyticum]|uniref:hypothetical protein n=1 Tax=Halosimplex amylolyticum TaxID=3396616 RepID=UPI003F551C7E
MKTEKASYGELMRENRQLRAALEEVLTALEESNTNADTTAARERMPDPPGQRRPIQRSAEADLGPGPGEVEER